MHEGDVITRTRRLSERCLVVVVDSLAPDRPGGVNIGAAEAARDAARLLGFEALAARGDALLRDRSGSDLLRGALTNIRLADEAKPTPLSRRALDELERAYPPFCDSYVPDLLSTGGDHLRPCLQRDYEAALAAAKCELEEFEVVLAQLLLGDLGEARRSFGRFPSRKENLQVVLAIELHRRNRFDEAEAVCSALLDHEPVWTPIHLALGISGRVPWSRYPLPDY